LANHKQEQLEAAMEILYRLSGFRRSLPTRNKIAYGSHVCKLDRDEMSNLNRGPSMDASYQVLFHLAQWFQRKRFLELDQPETIIAYHGRAW
jgi:hypothetical protein